MDNSIKITLIIVVTLAVLAVAGGYGFYNLMHPYTPGKNVEVQGVAEIKANPDVIGVYLNIETNGSTTEIANTENAEKVDELITELMKFGIERKKITTQSFSTYKWEEWENGQYVEKGYKATHSIKVELSSSETSLIGRVIDAAAGVGSYISYLNFELSQEKQNEYKAIAIKQASADARIQAQAMAEGLGLKLGDVISVRNQDYYYNPWRYYDYAPMASMESNIASVKEAATNIQPGEKDINARVSVVYELK